MAAEQFLLGGLVSPTWFAPNQTEISKIFFGLQHLVKTHQIQIVNVGKTKNHLLPIFQAGLRNLP